MRMIESESKHGSYILIIIGLITSYFGFYILTGIVAILLILWLFFCSTKAINPTIPNSIVTPISGLVRKVVQNEDSIEFSIDARFNGRIFSPCDLYDITTLKKKGFYFAKQNEVSNILETKEFLEAQTLLNNENLAIKIEVIPRLLRFCGINYDKTEALSLDKIGFLNVGTLTIKVIGKNINSLVQEGTKVLGGNTPLVTTKAGNEKTTESNEIN